MGGGSKECCCHDNKLGGPPYLYDGKGEGVGDDVEKLGSIRSTLDVEGLNNELGDKVQVA